LKIKLLQNWSDSYRFKDEQFEKPQLFMVSVASELDNVPATILIISG
jgi:hypothetical protein